MSAQLRTMPTMVADTRSMDLCEAMLAFERVRSAENSRASGAMPCQAVLLAVARPELPLSTEGKGHVRVFGRKDGCHRSCRRTAEYRNRSQSAQPRGPKTPFG